MVLLLFYPVKGALYIIDRNSVVKKILNAMQKFQLKNFYRYREIIKMTSMTTSTQLQNLSNFV